VRRLWLFRSKTAAAEADIGDRAGRAIGSGAGLIRAAIMDPMAPGDRDPALDLEMAAATAGAAAQTAPAILSGEDPSPAAITALTATKSAPFAGRMA
jgi:hypothetical protein